MLPDILSASPMIDIFMVYRKFDAQSRLWKIKLEYSAKLVQSSHFYKHFFL